MDKNNTPLISIIIPFYNPKAEYFKDAINSILSQSYTNWEVIIVNDGSNYESKTFLDEYIQSLSDKRFSVVSLEKNSGVPVARNKGIELARGEIITFLDADDMHLPWCYEEIIKTFSSSHECSVLAIPQFYYLSILKKPIILLPPNFASIISEKNSLYFILEKSLRSKLALACTPLIAFKKEVFNYVQYDPTLHTMEDFDLCLQILNDERLSKNIEIMPVCGYLYRIYFSNSRLTQKMDLLSDSKYKIINKYNDEDSLVYKFLQYIQTADDWKFSKEISMYSKNKSVYTYLKNVLKNGYSLKDKIKSIRALASLIIQYEILPNFFRIDFVHIKRALFNKKRTNSTGEIKNRFKDYLSSTQNKEAKLYANKIYEKIFTN